MLSANAQNTNFRFSSVYDLIIPPNGVSKFETQFPNNSVRPMGTFRFSSTRPPSKVNLSYLGGLLYVNFRENVDDVVLISYQKLWNYFNCIRRIFLSWETSNFTQKTTRPHHVAFSHQYFLKKNIKAMEHFIEHVSEMLNVKWDIIQLHATFSIILKRILFLHFYNSPQNTFSI